MAAQSKGGLFSPEAIIMLSIFGVLDIIDFFVGSVLIVDIIATLFYGVWVYFRGQAIKVREAQERIKEIRETKARIRGEGPEKIKKRRLARKKPPMAKKGKWLRRSLFFLEWIPIIGMIPGWTLMVYSELKD